MLVKAAVSTASKYSSVAIIGAGIGGLSAANALLHRNGVAGRVSVYERAECFHPTAGAGFGLSPNGQICLSSIGINEYRTFIQPFDTMKRITHDGVTVEQESEVLKNLCERHGFGIAGCFPADLVDLLVDKLNGFNLGNLAYSHKLVEIRPHLDKVELGFENGHQDLVDILIGADGINSSVAKLMNIDDETPPMYSGANIFYGKISHPENHPIFDYRSVVNGPGTGEFICFHVGAGDKRTMIWANTYSSENAPPKREDWNEGNRKELSGMLSKFPECHPIHELAKKTKEGDLLHFGLYYRHHKKTWSNDRIVLLGDACHATLPYVGQGANQAIEDAIYLADCLDTHGDHVAAYEDYYKMRFPRTKRIVQIAGLMHKLYHSDNWFVNRALDVLLRNVLRGGAILKQMEKEIINECPVKNYKQYAP